MTIKFAEQKIKEARQRVAALDRELADLRRQSRRVAKSPDTRVALLAMREQSARLEEERCRAYWELVGADRARRDAARVHGLGVKSALKSHPIAQALVAGLLQGLGERYGDDAMKVAGEQLAKQAVSDKPIIALL